MSFFAYQVYLGNQGNEDQGIIARGFTELWDTLKRWGTIVKNKTFLKMVWTQTIELVKFVLTHLARGVRYVYTLVFGSREQP